MNGLTRALLAVAGLGAGAAGTLAAVNRLLLQTDLPPTLTGANIDWQWRGWRVRYTKLGSGPPLVLVHSLHAAASSFEFRGIFEPLAQTHTVYALDLLGFGKSERPAIEYTGQLYARLLADFLAEQVDESATVLASSLASAYAVSVAASHPERVEHLVLVSPTDTTSAGLGSQIARSIFRAPVLGQTTFNLLVSQASIQSYLRRVYADPTAVDEALVGQAWATSHLPGARYAPEAFIRGQLDLPWDGMLGRVAVPVLVVRGNRSALGERPSDAEVRRLGPSIELATVEGAGQVPHDEAPDAFLTIVERWLVQQHG